MDLNAVAAEIRACRACPLHRSARQAVPGDGTGESGLFFLGEAPGYHEDVQGKPFVGAAGQFLDELLAGIGLDRRKVFITNVVRHRPPENRDPLPDEVAACGSSRSVVSARSGRTCWRSNRATTSSSSTPASCSPTKRCWASISSSPTSPTCGRESRGSAAFS